MVSGFIAFVYYTLCILSFYPPFQTNIAIGNFDLYNGVYQRFRALGYGLPYLLRNSVNLICFLLAFIYFFRNLINYLHRFANLRGKFTNITLILSLVQMNKI